MRSPPVDSGLEIFGPNSRNTGPTAEYIKLRAQSMKRHREYITGNLVNLMRNRDFLHLEFLFCR